MHVDVVCAGFGPATAGFVTTLRRAVVDSAGVPLIESRVAPGRPLQVLCFERADDIAAGVSGVVTRARGLRGSFPNLESADVPLLAPVTGERLVYLLDPVGVSRRSRPVRAIDATLRMGGRALGLADHAVTLPVIPEFLRKRGGVVLSLGQFIRWVADQATTHDAVRIWPGSPVAQPIFEGDRVVGLRSIDRGTDARGMPADTFEPGTEVHADLTVIGDGSVGAVGHELDAVLGLPSGHARDEWALGMKMVVDLRSGLDLEPGTIVHTIGYPEPEILGFFYVLGPRLVSLGIFVPSWFHSPVRTAYRYLQHWMLHPYMWRWLEGGSLRSWGAKSLQASGRRGEPYLVGDGYARIGEGSGSTNALTGSGVDEAWTTGVLLAEAVAELAAAREPFTRKNLEATYVRRRRASWLDRELAIAEGTRDSFERGLLRGILSMAVTGVSGGRLRLPRGKRLHPLPLLDEYFAGQMSPTDIQKILARSRATGCSMHDDFMDRCGWPAIPFDGRLLVPHDEALTLKGKVYAPPGYPDHVRFTREALCRACQAQLCVEMCSGQAITTASDGGVAFDRQKCVHCGACTWNCEAMHDPASGHTNVEFRAGAGGLHSVEN